MKNSMIHALDILEEEVQRLEKCLSKFDCEQHPEAKRNRDNKVISLKMAMDCIIQVNNGFNPLENGMFSHLNFQIVDCGKDGIKKQCNTCKSVIK